MQRLPGDGIAFVHAGGMLTSCSCKPGETLRVDTGCLVALQPSVNYDIQMVGGVKTALFGGEGPVLRHAHRARQRVAAVAAVHPPGRSHRQGHPRRHRRRPARRRLRARRPRQPVGRRLMPQFIYVMKGLGKVHPPDHVVLKDIWLSFLPGAKIGVLGLNGAGKSSLLASWRASTRTSSARRVLAQGSTVGYLPQEPQLDPRRPSARSSRRALPRRARCSTASTRSTRSSARTCRPTRWTSCSSEQGKVQDRIDAPNAWDLDRSSRSRWTRCAARRATRR